MNNFLVNVNVTPQTCTYVFEKSNALRDTLRKLKNYECIAFSQHMQTILKQDIFTYVSHPKIISATNGQVEIEVTKHQLRITFDNGTLTRLTDERVNTQYDIFVHRAKRFLKKELYLRGELTKVPLESTEVNYCADRIVNKIMNLLHTIHNANLRAYNQKTDAEKEKIDVQVAKAIELTALHLPSIDGFPEVESPISEELYSEMHKYGDTSDCDSYLSLTTATIDDVLACVTPTISHKVSNFAPFPLVAPQLEQEVIQTFNKLISHD